MVITEKVDYHLRSRNIKDNGYIIDWLGLSIYQNKLNGIVKFEELKYNMIYGKTKEQELYDKNYTIILASRKVILESEQQE